MGGRIAAAALNWLCDAAAQHYGIERAELLDAAGLEEHDLADLSARVPCEVAEDMARFIIERTGDPALGLRVAETFDFRTQGRWGYAVFSSLTLRERLEFALRYMPLRWPARGCLWVEGELALMEVTPEVDSEFLPTVLDCAIASTCTNTLPEVERVWLSYPEQPHHHELRALIKAPILFEAPCNRIAFPARHLGQCVAGDPHLSKLMRNELDAQLADVKAREQAGVLDEVRQQLLTRLASDASLERVARDLRVSARTLRRQLSELGASFRELLEEARQARATSYLLHTDDAVWQVAARLGYSDPSNFVRAFRRWTGVSPTAFRLQQSAPGQRAGASARDV